MAKLLDLLPEGRQSAIVDALINSGQSDIAFVLMGEEEVDDEARGEVYLEDMDLDFNEESSIEWAFRMRSEHDERMEEEHAEREEEHAERVNDEYDARVVENENAEWEEDENAEREEDENDAWLRQYQDEYDYRVVKTAARVKEARVARVLFPIV